MKIINFQLSGRFAHFLRAEASASALSYPIPPRTVILGTIGAILGLTKDEPQVILESANIAISGKIPNTHWHRIKFRKDPPELLPYSVKSSQKPDKITKPEKASLILQEWLFNPDYFIWVSLPDPYHTELENRLRERQWHFTPSLGLSEMLCDIRLIESYDECLQLKKGVYDVDSVVQKNSVSIEIDQIIKRELSIHLIRMPRFVTMDRIFSHCDYVMEKDARSIPLKTDKAYKVGNSILMFL